VHFSRKLHGKYPVLLRGGVARRAVAGRASCAGGQTETTLGTIWLAGPRAWMVSSRRMVGGQPAPTGGPSQCRNRSRSQCPSLPQSRPQPFRRALPRGLRRCSGRRRPRQCHASPQRMCSGRGRGRWGQNVHPSPRNCASPLSQPPVALAGGGDAWDYTSRRAVPVGSDVGQWGSHRGCGQGRPGRRPSGAGARAVRHRPGPPGAFRRL
jgi:hypothetical protein